MSIRTKASGRRDGKSRREFSDAFGAFTFQSFCEVSVAVVGAFMHATPVVLSTTILSTKMAGGTQVLSLPTAVSLMSEGVWGCAVIGFLTSQFTVCSKS